MAHAGVRLVDSRPDLAGMLADPSVAGELFVGSSRKVTWRCELGHEWEAAVSSVVAGHGCPYCSGRKVLPGFNDLATTHPDLAAELVDPEEALSVSAGSSSRKLRWRCASGHEWDASPYVRSTGHGCPVCAGRKVEVGFNDLESRRPDLVSQLVEPDAFRHVYFRSRKRLRWRCSEGHEWEATVADREKGDGCPVCANRRVDAGVNDLATVRPELAAQLADPSLATALGPKSTFRARWRCRCGHEWEATVKDRVRGRGCPVCSGNAVMPGVNDLATTHPDLAAELVDASAATTLSFGSGKVVEWRCGDCGHVWRASPNQRTSSGFGCPACSRAGMSEMEQECVGVVRALVGDDAVSQHDRTVLPGGLELDAIVPARSFALEFNGCFWHSEAVAYPADRNAAKHAGCRDAGYALVTVWEDDWLHRRGAVVSGIAAKLGALDEASRILGDPGLSEQLSARDMDVVDVTAADARRFLEANHVQGFAGATMHLGLADASGAVRALLSVRSHAANARLHRKSGEWEVQRYATHGIVRGGFSKLLAHAQRRIADEGLPLTRWVSFSANDVSDGHMYAACGFRLDAELPPDYRYVGGPTGWRRRPKESFQLSRFRTDGALLYEDGWTEHDAALANGLYRCYDSGKRRWVMDVAGS